MKFPSNLSLLAPVSLTIVLCSCANPANRRELYNTSQADSGPWHDYERRRQAEAETGVSGGSAPTVVAGSRERPTAQPPTSALPAGTSAAPAGTPAPVQGADAISGAPPAPVNPPTPAAVATPAPDTAVPAPAPDVAAPAPAATPPAP